MCSLSTTVCEKQSKLLSYSSVNHLGIDCTDVELADKLNQFGLPCTAESFHVCRSGIDFLKVISSLKTITDSKYARLRLSFTDTNRSSPRLQRPEVLSMKRSGQQSVVHVKFITITEAKC